MKKITNVRTSKSFKQKKDFITSLRAKQKFHLQLTDWTQLKDVAVDHEEKMLEWRKTLRDFPISEESDETTERELDSLIAEKPEVTAHSRHVEETVENNESDVEELYGMIEKLEKGIRAAENNVQEKEPEPVQLTPENAFEELRKCFNEYKANILIQNGIVEYNMKKLMLEEAIEKKVSDTPSETPLLDEDTTNHSEEDLNKIIESCKEYFKNINRIYVGLSKEEQSIYNMSKDDINNWFESHGYRYRCKN